LFRFTQNIVANTTNGKTIDVDKKTYIDMAHFVYIKKSKKRRIQARVALATTVMFRAGEQFVFVRRALAIKSRIE